MTLYEILEKQKTNLQCQKAGQCLPGARIRKDRDKKGQDRTFRGGLVVVIQLYTYICQNVYNRIP